jgi:N-acetylneuraminate synthase
MFWPHWKEGDMTIKPTLFAEIGCNHKGDINIAKEMIKIASQFCGVDGVKFQKRTVKELLTPDEYAAPHPNPEHSYGQTYGEHREALEFTQDQHRELMECCEFYDTRYSVSVWDLKAAQEMAELKPQSLKIPSASNQDVEMLRWLCENYTGEIHVSFGMTSLEEESNILMLFEMTGRISDLTIYACTSGYPVPFEDVCLHEVSRLLFTYYTRVKAIGFSGHHLGIAADVAALALGATYFERHFTLDRTWKGTDHSASLEPDGMRRLARDLSNVSKALTYKIQEILPIEQVQRKKLKRCVND